MKKIFTNNYTLEEKNQLLKDLLKEKYKDSSYDFSKVEYVKADQKVIIGCLEHGDVEVKISYLLDPKTIIPCPLCNKEINRRQKSQEYWNSTLLPKLNEKYQGSLDFSESVYVNATTPITYRCVKHGHKQALVTNLLASTALTGCKECAQERRTLTTEEFVERAKEVHGDRYNYDKTIYKDSFNKVEILCNECKEYFWQLPFAHLNGQGCPHCNGTNPKAPEEYKKYFEDLLGYKFDFSLSQFKGRKDPVEIVCKKCNEHFYKSPDLLYQDIVKRKNHEPFCPCCESPQQKWDTENFKEWLESNWGDKYDYSKVEYKNLKTNIELICHEHGSFWKRPNDLRNHRDQKSICPKCKMSEGEIRTADSLDELNIEYDYQKVFKDLRRDVNKPQPLKFDFYIPEFNLCIEYQGAQHYKQIPYWGGEEAYLDNLEKDQMKRDYCKENKISLLEIKYDIPLYQISLRLKELFEKVDFKNSSYHILLTKTEEIIDSN